MLLKFKIATLLCATGLIASSFAQLSKSCSDSKTDYFYKSSLNITESVLDCVGRGKNYSVFLAFQRNPSVGAAQEETISFQVVDNQSGKVKWGPEVDSNDTWTGWGIAVYKTEDVVDGISHSAVIRVPKRGNVYDQKQHWTTMTIPCQKNNLKLKTVTNEDERTKCDACGGSLLRSKDMKLEIQSNGLITIANKFDFKDDFQPRRIWCTR